MASVRGSPQHNLVIKDHRPERLVLLLGAALALLLVVALLSFAIGRSYPEGGSSQATPSLQQREARDQVVVLQQQMVVEQIAIENARQSIGELEEQIRQLNKLVAFYRSIMAPETLISGLHVQNLDIKPLEAANTYRLRWVLMQVGNNEQLIQGNVELHIGGIMASAAGDTSGAKEVVTKKFKFRYFQDFEADIVLPDGFQPTQVDAMASSKGKNSQKTSRKFDWFIKESLGDVAQ